MVDAEVALGLVVSPKSSLAFGDAQIKHQRAATRTVVAWTSSRFLLSSHFGAVVRPNFDTPERDACYPARGWMRQRFAREARIPAECHLLRRLDDALMPCRWRLAMCGIEVAA